ncbi:MAG: putative metal-dependent hydrolase [Ignavibacteria bacterium]|nr:putative metal-dependent hydrolase [Ignavibacteria bacterium]
MTTAERKGKIARIGKLPSILMEALRGLKDEQLDTPYRKGGWTVRQVVHHLADSHMNAMIRMKLILTEDHPTLKTYDQEKWAELADNVLPIEHSMMIVKGLHDRWVALLEQVSEEDWSRSADHPESGEVTLDDLLNIYANHGENHVKQITGLRSARGW